MDRYSILEPLVDKLDYHNIRKESLEIQITDKLWFSIHTGKYPTLSKKPITSHREGTKVYNKNILMVFGNCFAPWINRNDVPDDVFETLKFKLEEAIIMEL
jgi:hypothetical protein